MSQMEENKRKRSQEKMERDSELKQLQTLNNEHNWAFMHRAANGQLDASPVLKTISEEPDRYMKYKSALDSYSSNAASIEVDPVRRQRQHQRMMEDVRRNRHDSMQDLSN